MGGVVDEGLENVNGKLKAHGGGQQRFIARGCGPRLCTYQLKSE